jgi:hypothetical protein
MTEKAAGLAAELHELTELAEAHHASGAAAADLQALLAEETVYNTAAMGHHDELHHNIGEMEMCSQAGQPPAMADFEEAIEAIEEELANHKANIEAASDLAAAQVEEIRHEGAFGPLLADAATAEGKISATAGDFSCPHHGDEPEGHDDAPDEHDDETAS